MPGTFGEGLLRAFGPTGQSAEEFIRLLMKFVEPEPFVPQSGLREGEFDPGAILRDAINFGGTTALQAGVGPRTPVKYSKGLIEAVEGGSRGVEKVLKKFPQPKKVEYEATAEGARIARKGASVEPMGKKVSFREAGLESDWRPSAKELREAERSRAGMAGDVEITDWHLFPEDELVELRALDSQKHLRLEAEINAELAVQKIADEGFLPPVKEGGVPRVKVAPEGLISKEEFYSSNVFHGRSVSHPEFASDTVSGGMVGGSERAYKGARDYSGIHRGETGDVLVVNRSSLHPLVEDELVSGGGRIESVGNEFLEPAAVARVPSGVDDPYEWLIENNPDILKRGNDLEIVTGRQVTGAPSKASGGTYYEQQLSAPSSYQQTGGFGSKVGEEVAGPVGLTKAARDKRMAAGIIPEPLTISKKSLLSKKYKARALEIDEFLESGGLDGMIERNKVAAKEHAGRAIEVKRDIATPGGQRTSYELRQEPPMGWEARRRLNKQLEAAGDPMLGAPKSAEKFGFEVGDPFETLVGKPSTATSAKGVVPLKPGTKQRAYKKLEYSGPARPKTIEEAKQFVQEAITERTNKLADLDVLRQNAPTHLRPAYDFQYNKQIKELRDQLENLQNIDFSRMIVNE